MIDWQERPPEDGFSFPEITVERDNMQDERLARLEKCMLAVQKSLIRAHQEIVEIKADLMAAGIPKEGKSSTLILPDRMN